MTTKILPPVALTVDELIALLQGFSAEGLGAAPVEALLGDDTLPVRGADTLPAWGTPTGLTVLLQLDDAADARGQVQRARGNSLTG
ncbi:hypothetical protein [Cupriavidus oxalaticus]|uniref:Uncharacterized protein n=1 Tax=Cupriavidus oxalaticus TaxID=96344 RepID=A0A4P7LUH7_9BURK|nr:hypothetical protein [Cupriavidus oxalaticus]QBY56121.1 hypothetical protein E0W60_34240 [Cupriavidus oxalaticus]